MLIDEIEQRKQQQLQRQQEQENETEGDVRVGYAIIMSCALSIVNCMLSAVARLQYSQTKIWGPSISMAAKSAPIYGIIIYLLHPFNSRLASVLGLIASVGFGCAKVWIFNNESYYASMSKVPQLGTMWIWLVIELHYGLGALSSLLVGLYTWWNSFSIV